MPPRVETAAPGGAAVAAAAGGAPTQTQQGQQPPQAMQGQHMFQAGGHLVLAQATGQQPAVPSSTLDVLALGATGPDGRPISCEDIQKVQNLIEKCLQMYMSQAEVVNTLKTEAGTQPRFTTLVWQKLEEQNPEFFRAYYTRLKLKDQILLFNHLLEQQVQMFQKIRTGNWMQPAANPQLIAQRPHMPGQMHLQALPGTYAAGPMHMQAMPGQHMQPGPGMPQQQAVALQQPGAQPASADSGKMPEGQAGMALDRGAIPVQQLAVSQPDPQFNRQMMHGMRPMGMDFNQAPAVSASMAPFQMDVGDYQLAMSSADMGILQNMGAGPTTNGLSAHGQAEPHAELNGLPRNFSLSDLNLDMNGNLSNEEELAWNSGLGGDAPDDMQDYNLGIDLGQ
eukprot:jgi/Tetstr1/424852/TSEL_015355.t1